MKKPTLSTFLYGGIAVCITVMLILFAGSLSGDDDKIESAPVTDLLFTPESVVQLTAENQQLRDSIDESAEAIDDLSNDLMTERNKNKVFNLIAKAVRLAKEGNIDGAKNIIDSLDLTDANENTKALYDIAKEQIE